MPKKAKGAQRTSSALKGAANDRVEYLFIANQEVVKNLNPTKKAQVMKLMSDYQADIKHNAAENKKYLEEITRAYAVNYPPEQAKHYAKMYAAENPLSRVQPERLRSTANYYGELKTELYQGSPVDVLNAKRTIFHQINSDTPTPLNIFLKNLPEDKKRVLAAAILTGDGEKIEHILFPGTPPECPLIADKAHLVQAFKGLTQGESVEKTIQEEPLSIAASAVLKALARPRDGQSAMLDKAKKAQEILFFERVMKSIPDVDLTPKLKNDILKQCIDRQSAHLVDPFYFESAEHEDPHRAQLHGKMNAQQFQIALSDPRMDNSEFIVLSLALLTKECGTAPELPAIRAAYLERDYESAIAQILTVCRNNRTLLSEPLVSAIEAKSVHLVEVNPAKNYHRRYIENALAREHLLSHVNLERINRVCRGISGVSFDISDPTKAVDIVRDAVSSVNDFHKYDHEAIRVRQYALGDATAAWLAREKQKKEGFDRKADEAHTGGGNVAFSRNVGMMVANQPAPRDEVAEHDQINRTPDKSAGHGKYSPRAHRSAMAGDVSGHTLWLVARLEAYMKEFPTNPPLTDDVNEFVKGFVSTYIMRGSHSLDEVYDILRSPAIQAVFTAGGVTLDLSWSEPLVKKAMEAGQDYAKNLALQKAVNDELLSPIEGTSSHLQRGLKPTTPTPKAEVVWTEAEKEMLAEIQKQNEGPDKERHALIDNLNKLRKYANDSMQTGNLLALELSAILPKNNLHQDTALEALLPIKQKLDTYLTVRAHNKNYADLMLNDPSLSPLLSTENKAAVRAVVAKNTVSSVAPTPITPPPNPEREARIKHLADIPFDTILDSVQEEASSSHAKASEFRSLHTELLQQKEAFLKSELNESDFHMALERAVKITTDAIKQETAELRANASKPRIITSTPDRESKELYLKTLHFEGMLRKVHAEFTLHHENAEVFKELHAELSRQKEAFLDGTLSKADFKMAIERATRLSISTLSKNDAEEFLSEKEFDSVLAKIETGISSLQNQKFTHAAEAFQALHTKLSQNKQQLLDGKITEAQFETRCQADIRSCSRKALFTPGAKETSDEIINYAKGKLGLETNDVKHHNTEEQVFKMKGALSALKAERPLAVTLLTELEPDLSRGSPALGA